MSSTSSTSSTSSMSNTSCTSISSMSCMNSETTASWGLGSIFEHFLSWAFILNIGKCVALVNKWGNIYMLSNIPPSLGLWKAANDQGHCYKIWKDTKYLDKYIWGFWCVSKLQLPQGNVDEYGIPGHLFICEGVRYANIHIATYLSIKPFLLFFLLKILIKFEFTTMQKISFEIFWLNSYLS